MARYWIRHLKCRILPRTDKFRLLSLVYEVTWILRSHLRKRQVVRRKVLIIRIIVIHKWLLHLDLVLKRVVLHFIWNLANLWHIWRVELAMISSIKYGVWLLILLKESFMRSLIWSWFSFHNWSICQGTLSQQILPLNHNRKYLWAIINRYSLSRPVPFVINWLSCKYTPFPVKILQRSDTVQNKMVLLILH